MGRSGFKFGVDVAGSWVGENFVLRKKTAKTRSGTVIGHFGTGGLGRGVFESEFHEIGWEQTKKKGAKRFCIKGPRELSGGTCGERNIGLGGGFRDY